LRGIINEEHWPAEGEVVKPSGKLKLVT